MNQADDLARGPHAVLRVAVDEDLAATLAADEGGHLGELASLALALDLEGVLGYLVAEQARGVAPAAQQQGGVGLLGLDDGLLDGAVHGCLLRAEEPGAHVDATGAEAEGRRKALAVGEPARGDERNLEGLAGPGEKDEVGDVRFTDVAGYDRLAPVKEANSKSHNINR